MDITRLSSKGQLIIPKRIRNAKRWSAGLEMEVIEVEEGLLLKPRSPFPETAIDDVAGCLSIQGPAKTQAEIDDAMRAAAKAEWRAVS